MTLLLNTRARAPLRAGLDRTGQIGKDLRTAKQRYLADTVMSADCFGTRWRQNGASTNCP
jgi:hypothetical protein